MKYDTLVEQKTSRS